MTLDEQIQLQVKKLPLEKQAEVMDFIAFLQQRTSAARTVKRASLKTHTAFGSWKRRKIDSVKYQQRLRAEWDN